MRIVEKSDFYNGNDFGRTFLKMSIESSFKDRHKGGFDKELFMSQFNELRREKEEYNRIMLARQKEIESAKPVRVQVSLYQSSLGLGIPDHYQDITIFDGKHYPVNYGGEKLAPDEVRVGNGVVTSSGCVAGFITKIYE